MNSVGQSIFDFNSVKINEIISQLEPIFSQINGLDIDGKVEVINKIREMLHEYSPLKAEPVDLIRWIKSDLVFANDYNPNKVAPPEMKLLEHSIIEDGYTQPIVAWKTNDQYEVIDGFHRNRVGKESTLVKERIRGYLPLSIINKEREDRGDRIASTIRHNRARGKHIVQGMSEIILELKNRNWANEKIAKNLGMDEDEILRLCQITGLAGLFSDKDFSRSWNIEDSEPDFIPLSDDLEVIADESDEFRTVNTNDPNRIFHTHDKWECRKAGFYATTHPTMTREECENAYRKFLLDEKRFADALEKVIGEWKHSCEHYLTNTAMNRIAWLGQAAMCYATGIPAIYRGGFNLLNEKQKRAANELALVYLNKWLVSNNRKEVTLEEGLSSNQMDLY